MGDELDYLIKELAIALLSATLGGDRLSWLEKRDNVDRHPKGRMTMATALLKSGETIELPFEQMQQFVAEHPELIEKQHSEMPRRRKYSKTTASH